MHARHLLWVNVVARWFFQLFVGGWQSLKIAGEALIERVLDKDTCTSPTFQLCTKITVISDTGNTRRSKPKLHMYKRVVCACGCLVRGYG